MPPERPATILIVDDDPGVRKVAARRLAQEGYRVLTAENGHQALALAGAERPQLILLDILMPGIDGREVLRRLSADAATADIPVVLLTVIGTGEEVAAPDGSPESAYAARLTKPYQPHELLQTIRTVLSRRRA
jgi:CheY-like chemotaxis protein